MRNKLFITAILLSSLIFMLFVKVNATPAFALDENILNNNMKDVLDAGVGANYPTTTVNEDSLYSTIGYFVQIVLSVIGVLLMILIIYAGFLWMGAQGNEEQITKAKAYIQNAIIGVIIVLMAYSITYFIMAKLSGAVAGV
ncbi:hypothetical protein ACFL23_01410 [Patescibacteria group bacterium]